MIKSLINKIKRDYITTFTEVDDVLLLGKLTQTHTYQGKKLRWYLWTQYTIEGK